MDNATYASKTYREEAKRLGLEVPPLKFLDWEDFFSNRRRPYMWTQFYDDGTAAYIAIDITKLYKMSRTELRWGILHEFAHVIAGPGEGHGPVWEEAAARVGIIPSERIRIQADISAYDRIEAGMGILDIPTPDDEWFLV